MAEEDALLRALIYGDPGCGKTTFIGTFTEVEESSPVLCLNSRGQPITFRLFENPPLVFDVLKMTDYNLPYQWIKTGQPWYTIQKGVERTPPERFCLAVWNYIQDRCDLSPEVLWQEGLPNPCPFKTIALDSLTQTQRISLREITGDVSKLPGDIPTATNYAAWGKTLGQLTLLADLYYTLPVHVIVTALRRHQFVEAQGITMYYPFFWGQSANELPAYAEMLGMLVQRDSLPVQQAMQLEKVELPDGEDPFNVLILRGGRTHNAKWQGVRNPPATVVNPKAATILGILGRGLRGE